MPTLRLRLRPHREAKGLSQEELAAAAGVRQATISSMETGKSGRVDLDVVAKLAAVLGVHPCDLLEWQPEKRRRP